MGTADNTVKETPAIVKAMPSILSSAGFIWGLGYSFKHKKGFWAYVGYSFLGSVVGATAGGIIYAVASPASVVRTESGNNFSGSAKYKSSTKKEVKGNCTCPDGHKYPCTGERTCSECCHKFLD